MLRVQIQVSSPIQIIPSFADMAMKHSQNSRFEPSFPADLRLLRRKKSSIDLSDVFELLPGLSHPVVARAQDPLLHLSQARLDVLTVAEGATLSPQQELVEELDVHKAEKLLEELAHQEGRHIGLLQGCQQGFEHLQDVGPVLAELR